MKTKVNHRAAPNLEQFFKLFLTFAGERVHAERPRPRAPAQPCPVLKVVRVSDYVDALPSNPRPIRRSRVAFRAFMTMLLTLGRTPEGERRRLQNSVLPNGAVFAVRYVSR